MLPKTLTARTLIRGIGLRRSFGRSIYKPATITTELWIGNTNDTNQSNRNQLVYNDYQFTTQLLDGRITWVSGLTNSLNLATIFTESPMAP